MQEQDTKTSRVKGPSPEPFDEVGELKDQVINIRRVTKVVKGGKNLSFSALVAVGNGHGPGRHRQGQGPGSARRPSPRPSRTPRST